MVYVVKAGKAAATPVETGISDDLWVEIRSGLQEGAKVVSGPYKVLKTLRDGDAVNPKAEPDEDGEEDAAKVKVRVG